MPIKMRNKKVTKLKRFPLFNIGTVMFGIVFLYMVICIIMYLTSSHTTPYEVTAGPLSGNYRFSALALKSEKVITAEQAGTVNYYAREGGKVGAGNNVYSIGGLPQTTAAPTVEKSNSNTTETGNTVTTENVQAASEETDALDLDSKSLSKIRNNIATYSNGFNEMSFQNIYNFKADTQSTILELANEKALSEMESTGDVTSSSVLGNLYQAPQEGIVVYAVDQDENLTINDIKTSNFDQKNYHKENLRLKQSVKVGEPVYKLITSEDWSLVIPIDKKLATELANKETVRFRFLKDGSTFNAGFSIVQNGTEAFGKLDISNSVIRYAGDRFIEIELIMERETGLKIPKSSIAEKEFYKVPKEFVTVNEDNPNEVSILREAKDDKDNVITKYVTATVYDSTDDEYYIGTSLFKVGDSILKKDSSKKFQIAEMGNLQGVYNINKGYAVFREIKIIDENEEYCIVETGSSYGLSQYDRIALKAETVNEEDIVY